MITVTTAKVPVNQREAILDQALALMSSHGAAGMSMRQLAAACGLHVAAIYHYFESKDALLAAVVSERRYRSRLVEPFEIDPGIPAPDRLRALLLHVWQGSLDEEAIWRLLLGEGIRGEPAVLSAGSELLDLVEAASMRWIADVLPEIDRPGRAARLLVDQLLAGLVHLIFDGSATGTPEDRADAGRRMAERAADTLAAAVLD